LRVSVVPRLRESKGRKTLRDLEQQHEGAKERKKKRGKMRD